VTARLDRIVRHPFEAAGYEEVGQAAPEPGRPLPFDRIRALAHAGGRKGVRDDPSDAARLIAWRAPLRPDSRPAPAAAVPAGTAAFIDVPAPFVPVVTLASNRDLGARMGRTLSQRLRRANVRREGPEPRSQVDLVGRALPFRAATPRIESRITRCEATAGNPETGRRDADTPGAPEAGRGHTDFGVRARVIGGGTVRAGDPVVPA
jgi:uncharacterized protein YcbX